MEVKFYELPGVEVLHLFWFADPRPRLFEPLQAVKILKCWHSL